MKPPVDPGAAALAMATWLITLLMPAPTSAQSMVELFRYNERGQLASHQVNGTEVNHRYDRVDRLIEQSSPNGTFGNARRYVMDVDGNRLADQRSTYLIPPGAQRVAARDGVALAYSPAGHLLADRTWLNDRWAQRSFSWNTAGQLKSATINGLPAASYLYNEGGQRTRKTLAAPAAGVPQVTLYRYDPQGQLVLEVAGTAAQAPGIAVSPGQVLVRYIWQYDVPVAVIWPPMTPGNPGASTDRVVHLTVDHLNTPRRALDAQGVVVWTWRGEAFGADLPDEDADRDGRQTVINLRFSGQYFDAESGLHYNWHRYYDPQVGRYIQSDPIGLAGGINTYTYVEGNPVSSTDPLGLATYMCTQPLHALGAAGRRFYSPSSNPFHHQFIGIIRPDGSVVTGGQDRAGGPWGPGRPSEGDGAPGSGAECKKVEDDNECIEQCLMGRFAAPRPRYSLVLQSLTGGQNCQVWADSTLAQCQASCQAKQ